MRIWDIFLFDGDCVLPAIAYTIMKMHKRQLMSMNTLDDFYGYLHVKLEKDFGYDDDKVINAVEQNTSTVVHLSMNSNTEYKADIRRKVS